MTVIVIDSSVALSWCFEDEASAEMDSIFEHVRDQGAVVPGIWHLEVGNVLLQAEKRGRITTSDATARLALITELPIMTDHDPVSERHVSVQPTVKVPVRVNELPAGPVPAPVESTVIDFSVPVLL